MTRPSRVAASPIEGHAAPRAGPSRGLPGQASNTEWSLFTPPRRSHFSPRLTQEQVFVFASKPERAVGHFEAAIRLNPHHPAGYLQGLGIAYFAMDDLEQAAALFERALQRNPDLWYSTGFLAASHGHLGRDEEATAAL